MRTLSQKGRGGRDRKTEEREKKDEGEEGEGRGEEGEEVKKTPVLGPPIHRHTHRALQLAALVSGADSTPKMPWLPHLQNKTEKPPANSEPTGTFPGSTGVRAGMNTTKGKSERRGTRNKARNAETHPRVAFKGTSVAKCHVWP